MATAIRKAAIVLAVPALVGSVGGVASADPAGTSGFDNCPSGFVCFYTGVNGSGAKCQWSGPDSQHADDCSWAADTVVKSVYNHGTDSSFIGLCYYRLPDYKFKEEAPVRFLLQGQHENVPSGGWKVLSHRWVTPFPVC